MNTSFDTEATNYLQLANFRPVWSLSTISQYLFLHEVSSVGTAVLNSMAHKLSDLLFLFTWVVRGTEKVKCLAQENDEPRQGSNLDYWIQSPVC